MRIKKPDRKRCVGCGELGADHVLKSEYGGVHIHLRCLEASPKSDEVRPKTLPLQYGKWDDAGSHE